MVLVCFLLFCSVANAELRSSVQPIMFELSTDDGSLILPAFSFCDVDSFGGEEAQATCMMTPGGSNISLLLENPITYNVLPETRLDLAPNTSLAAAVTAPYRANIPSFRGIRDPGTTPEPEVSMPPPDDQPSGHIIPAPSTLLILAPGLAGLFFLKRRQWISQK